MVVNSEKERKSRLAKVLLLLASSLLAALFLEQAYRFTLFGRDALSMTKLNSLRAIGLSGLLKPSPHLEVMYELKPNVGEYFKMAWFETNSQGLRDKEYAFEKPEDTFRIAVVGDSFTMPAGVRIEDAFHSILEDRLNEESEEKRYEFINFAIGGYGLRNYRGVIENRVEPYDPDLLLIGFCADNDHEPLPSGRFSKPYRVKAEAHPFYKSFVLRKIRQIRRAREKEERQSERLADESGEVSVLSEEEEEHVTEMFSDFARFGKEHSIPVVVAYLANGPVDPRFRERVGEIAAETDLSFVDASIPLEGVDPSDYRLFDIDSHPNDRANRVFADRIYDQLKALGLL